MIEFAKILKTAGVKFRWTIFTDRELYKVNNMGLEEIVYMKSKYDIWDYIQEADYGVQLSDTEGYSYFINECLQYGTAMIVTDFPSAHESVIDGENGYILNKDLSNLHIDKIVNKIPKGFNYKQETTVDTWTKYLGGAEYKEKGERSVMRNIRIKTAYQDLQPRKTIRNGKNVTETDIYTLNGEERFNAKIGDILTVPNERALFLVESLKVASYDGEVIEEAVKPKPKKETAKKKTNAKK